MKWIGQHIWDFISRFRSDVYLEDIADGTVVDNKFLGLDSNNKIVKEAASTTVTDLHTAGVDGSNYQLLTDNGDGTVNSEANLTFASEILSVGANDTGVGSFRRTQRTTAGAGGSLTVSGGTPKSGETDTAGGMLSLHAGKGTGTGVGGDILLSTYVAAGSTGTSFNTAATSWRLHGDGTSAFETPGPIELGHASDTTIARSAAGIVTVEGKQVFTTNTPALTSGAAGVPAVVMQTRRTITTAEANAMNSTPIVLVPAQGANTIIVPLGGEIRVDRAANQTNSAADWNMHIQDHPGIYGTNSVSHIRRFMYNEGDDRVYHITPTLVSAEVLQGLSGVNKELQVSFDSATTSNCFTSIEVYLTYQVFNIA